MSAIGGIVTRTENVTVSALEKMLTASTHRGTDTQTLWHSQTTGFIHRQLWTTPESLHEAQPLHSEKESVVLTADARIDNRQELMEKLSLSPTSEDLITDAELILKSYLEWGHQCVEHLIGDFSFAILDIEKDTLFCARDHLGIKPFYFATHAGNFYFASEISAIFSTSEIEKKPNHAEIKHFMKVRAISCDATFFESIQRLRPGHLLTYSAGTLQTKRYWFPEKTPINTAISLTTAKRKLRTLLQQAVDSRLRNAYGTGCHLSGGVDSSSILALTLNSETSTPVTVFSSYFGDLSCDERQHVEVVAKKFELDPVVTRADQLDYSNEFSLSNYYASAPDWPGSGSFLDSRAEMAKAKERNIRVILTGQGGDHIATGDDSRFTDYFLNRDFKRLWAEHRERSISLKACAVYFLFPLLSEKSKYVVRRLLGKATKKHFFYRQSCLEDTVCAQSQMQKAELGLLCGAGNHFWMDSNPYTAIGGLYDIEYRHPYFDKRVVDFMLSLPPWMKIFGYKYKIILREAMQDLLPKSTYSRQDKAEFTPVIAAQVKSNTLLLTSEHQNSATLDYNLAYNQINESWKELLINKWLLENFEEGDGKHYRE